MTEYRHFDPASTDLRGTHLIEASAGTGKTYTITSIVSRLIAELGVEIDRILIVTFTEAATAELRDRVRARLIQDAASGDPGAQPRFAAALRNFDEAAIFTIHGFCKRILEEHAFESDVSYDVELVSDVLEMCREVVTDYWADRLYGADPLFVRCLELEKVTIEELVKLVLTAAAQPYLRILPERSLGEEDALEEFRAAFAGAARMWREDKQEIIETLDAAWDGLSKRSYSLKLKQSKEMLLNSFFSGSESTDVKLYKDIERFSSSSLEARVKKNCEPPRGAFFEACERLCRARERLSDVAVRFRQDGVDWCLRGLEERKEQAGVQSFDDLLLQMRRALRDERGGGALARAVRSRFHAVLIDEFQDTDPVQYEIFSSIYEGSQLPLFLIGDPKQSIYGFRGADVFTYLEAVRDAGDNVFGLDTNWRSDPGLVRGVEALFSGSRRPFLLPGIGYPRVWSRDGAEDAVHCDDEPAPPLRFGFVSLDDVPAVALQKNKRAIKKTEAVPLVAERLAGRVVTLLGPSYSLDTGSGHRRLEAPDIAVLVRSNSQAERVREALNRRGIKAVCYGQKGVFETKDAHEMLTVLTAVAHTTSSEKLRAALATEALGLTGDEIEELASDESDWERWVERFGQWKDLWRSRGVEATLRKIFEEKMDDEGETMAARMLARPDGERRLTNWRHITELLGEAEAEDHLGPLGVLRDLERRIAHEKSDQEALVRMESDEAAVKVLTVHKSKGLEFPVVLCPYLWDSALERPGGRRPVAFHDGGEAVLDIGSKDLDTHRRYADDEALAEGLRLAYVAVTRARHMCEVVIGPFAGVETSPLAYALFADDSVRTASQLADHMKAKAPDALFQGLERVVRNAPGDIAVYRLQAGKDDPASTSETAATRLHRRELRAACEKPERTESFTSLITGGGRDLFEGLTEAVDEVDLSLQPRREGSEDQSGPLVLADFPRGPRSGTCLHAIFEKWEPVSAEGALEVLVAEQLVRHGFDEGMWAGPVTRNVGDVLAARLYDPNGPRLADIPGPDRLAEMEFVFPVGEGSRFNPDALSECFARDNCAVSRRYAPLAAQLDFGRLSGFLKGYIDLVFRYEGRYYIVDYKSNDLGPTRADYGEEHLIEAMVGGHYVLQEHLYAVALHRYLSVRLVDYDYETHFGGAFYLFLRGMDAGGDRTSGIFFHRPAAALIRGLDERLGGKLA